MDRRGDLRVGRTIIADRRVDAGASAQTLSAQKDLDRHSHAWLRLSNATTQDVILPDATDLPLGWSVVVDVPSASTAPVKVKKHGGAALKSIEQGRAYKFTCVDIGSAAGVWYINFLEEADLIPTERYVEAFDNDEDWTDATPYWTITVNETDHGRGTKPTVQVFQKESSDYIQVSPDRILVDASGNVTMRVPTDPNLRFEGEMIFI